MSLESLPYEILEKIFTQLDVKSLSNIMVASTSLYMSLLHTRWSHVTLDMSCMYSGAKEKVYAAHEKPSSTNNSTTAGIVVNSKEAFTEFCHAILSNASLMTTVLASTQHLDLHVTTYSQNDPVNFKCRSYDDIKRVSNDPHYLVYWLCVKVIPEKFRGLKSITVELNCDVVDSGNVMRASAITDMLQLLPPQVATRLHNKTCSELAVAQLIQSPKINYPCSLRMLKLTLAPTSKDAHKHLAALCGCQPLPPTLTSLEVTSSSAITIKAEYFEFLFKYINGYGSNAVLELLALGNIFIDCHNVNWLPASVTKLAIHAGNHLLTLPNAIESIEHLIVLGEGKLEPQCSMLLELPRLGTLECPKAYLRHLVNMHSVDTLYITGVDDMHMRNYWPEKGFTMVKYLYIDCLTSYRPYSDNCPYNAEASLPTLEKDQGPAFPPSLETLHVVCNRIVRAELEILSSWAKNVFIELLKAPSMDLDLILADRNQTMPPHYSSAITNTVVYKLARSQN